MQPDRVYNAPCNAPRATPRATRHATPRATPQAVASEKVRAMKPAFEAELNALRDERGCGATVTGEDVKAILPRVLARQAQAAAQQAQQAQP